jgi:hypothetical protein
MISMDASFTGSEHASADPAPHFLGGVAAELGDGGLEAVGAEQ